MKLNTALTRSFLMRAVVAAFLVVMTLAFTALPASAQGASGTSVQGASGTTLSAYKTAEGFWERQKTYDWTIDKSVSPESLTIERNASQNLTYTITVTRSLASQTDVIGVSGQICVTNGGDRTTENLKLVDQVEYKDGSGQFQSLPGATQTIIPAQQLGPGQSQCYNYQIFFTPVPGATYRNSVKVTITNHSGHLGTEFGPNPKADFSLPPSPAIVEFDENASVTDTPTCPTGFTCTPAASGPWYFTDSDRVVFTTQVTNTSALCDTYYNLDNTATLTESDTGQQHHDSATVSIYTGQCARGCTLTIGYWKTHAGFTGRNPDRVSQFLPIWLGTPNGAKSVEVTTAAQAANILSMNSCDGPSNGITKLYAQLLAAKLNIGNGADGSAAAATIAAADAFLATYGCDAWSSLARAQKNQVLGWATTLDNYNNGLLGPGHCNL